MTGSENIEGYKVTLTGSGIAVDREVDQATALAVMQLVLGGGVPPTPAMPRGAAGVVNLRPDDPNRRLSLREILEESRAKTIPEKIVTIGAFLRDQEALATFSREANKAKFKTAGEAAPANFPRDFAKAIRLGWVAEDHENSGEFYVTRRGDDAVAQRFEGGTMSATGIRRRRRNRGSGVTTSGESENE